ncbi:FUSC family protein [Aurantimonas sp. VKM B-3413]|uniref:FUSC family protein n=1 Tax=Aurantimonas sp. VKM B-3413 TaxID=2779401 RepID=UPI001E335C70|nr:FUSC family protein [Aurantimonas sp. VKM B-3413]MCB8837409.1 FUSC family protein [Aurantimonas sp. VKM B-3413]
MTLPGNLPTGREWLFGVKTFAASMLALYIALAAGLPRPYWAMATVFIVANPLSGATRSKAVYRAAGTCLGAAVSILVTPLFVDRPLLMSAVVGIWTGGLLFVSFLDRTPRSYMFMLAGYTLPLIALPTVGDPSTIFDVATARAQEITLGITCASLVNALVFPQSLGPVVGARVSAWLADAGGWIRHVLAGEDPARLKETQRLAPDVKAVDQLVAQLRYDPEMGGVVRAARQLRGRLVMLPPLLSSLADRLGAVEAEGGLPEEVAALAGDVRAFVEDQGGDRLKTAGQMAARVSGLHVRYGDAHDWHTLLVASALARLADLVDLWHDCLVLEAEIVAGRDAQRPPALRLASAAANVPHYDFGMMAFSAGSAMLAIFLACLVWIVSGWDQGAGFVMIAGVACSFFAASDNPIPMIRMLTILTAAGCLVAGIYLFGILPHVETFAGLVAVFSPFILVGPLIARPKYSFIGLLLAVNAATLVSLQEVYAADFERFANGAIATVAGGLFALVWMILTRPFGAALAARRLARQGWAEIAAIAGGRRGVDPAVFAGRVFDRLGQIAPRLAQGVGGEAARADALLEMRIGLSVLDLRRSVRAMPRPVRPPLEAVLSAVAGRFEDLAVGRRRTRPPGDLVRRIDDALAACLDAPAQPARSRALQSLVGLRRALCPDAPPPESALLAPAQQPLAAGYALAAE